MSECKGRTIAPVLEVASHGPSVVERRDVVECKPVAKGKSNWRLLCSSLAKTVIGAQLAPVEGCLVVRLVTTYIGLGDRCTNLVCPVILCGVGRCIGLAPLQV